MLEENDENLYGTLSVPRNASSDEINKAYKRMEKLLHPDKQQPGQHSDGKQAHQLDDVREANRILSDPDLRNIYDAAGLEALKLVKFQGARSRSHFDIISEIRLQCSEDALKETMDAANHHGGGTVQVSPPNPELIAKLNLTSDESQVQIDATHQRRAPQVTRWFVSEKCDIFSTQSLNLEPETETPLLRHLEFEGKSE